MSSSEGASRTEGMQPAIIDKVHGLTAPPKQVWVRLDCLYVRDPGKPAHVNGAGVEMTGEVPGHLTHWVPTLRGDWMGRVSYSVRYADGRPALWLPDQLVPDYALRPRAPDDAPDAVDQSPRRPQSGQWSGRSGS